MAYRTAASTRLIGQSLPSHTPFFEGARSWLPLLPLSLPCPPPVKVRAGMFRFVFDVPGSVTDWLHVENLVQALVLADEALGAGRKHVAAGQVSGREGRIKTPRQGGGVLLS